MTTTPTGCILLFANLPRSETQLTVRQLLRLEPHPSFHERLARSRFPACRPYRLPQVLPNFYTLMASTAAKPQNSAVLLDGNRIVVLKIAALRKGFRS